jgi:hypothetical protein
MKIIFLLNFVVSLIIFLFVIIKFSKNYKKTHSKKIFDLFLVIGLLYLVFSIILFAWSFDFLKYSSSDFSIIYSLIVFIQTFLLFNIIYLIRKNKRIFYFFFPYLSIFSSTLIHVPISSIILICSFLITLTLFILLFPVSNFGNISKFGIIYSSLSLIIQIAFLFNKDLYIFLSFVSNILFGIFLISLINQIEKLPLFCFEQQIRHKKRYYLLDFLRYFIFIIILTNFIFIGTITVHEVGHLLSARTFGCEFGKIVYEEGLPHTEILCNNSFNSLAKSLLGGMLLPILIAILLYFAGGTFIRELSLLIIGFDFIISYQDILDLGISKNLSIFLSIIGGILILLAIGLLAKSRTSEEEFMHLG